MEFYKNLITFLVVVVLFLSNQNYYGAEGRIISLSKEEDLELQRQLKILNKPPIKTIRTKIGDIFDCIDINKQPAFDHPLLKNHKIQMKPNFILQQTNNEAASSMAKVAKTELQLHSERCPSGTVPIMRTKKEDLINAKYLIKHLKPSAFEAPNMPTHFTSIEPNVSATYYGGKAAISVYNPPTEADQFSTAQIWLQNGPVEQLNSLEFGWAVFFKLSGDNRTRLFAFWTADGFKRTGCFNMLCSGFVQVHPSIALGDAITQTSVYRGQKYEIEARVFLEERAGWWLLYGGEKDTPEAIGYWPREIFTHLANSASVVRYGGLAGADPKVPTPQMGNGHLPSNQDFTEACYMRNMKVAVDERGGLLDFDTSSLLRKQDTLLSCYNLIFNGYVDSTSELVMSFGGPGGECP